MKTLQRLKGSAICWAVGHSPEDEGEGSPCWRCHAWPYEHFDESFHVLAFYRIRYYALRFWSKWIQWRERNAPCKDCHKAKAECECLPF